MSVRIYTDHCVHRAIVEGVRQHGVDVLTSSEDGTADWEDDRLLDRASALERALFSVDDDLLREATRRQRVGEPFSGVIYVHQLRLAIGSCIDDLVLIAEVMEPEEMAGTVIFLPLASPDG